MAEEFDETALFGADEGGNDGGCSSSDSDEGAVDAGTPLASKTSAGVDIIGTSIKSGSIHSSTLRASLDEQLHDAEADLCGAACGGGGGGGGNRRPRFPIAASLPARTSAVQMGSSVPIAIPSLPRWKPGATCQPGSAGEGAPFVPPHEMAGAAGGDIAASPSAVLKRERLRARNAILRSTGFLEPKDGPSGGAFSSGGGGGGGASGVGGGAAPGVAHSLPAGGGGLARLEARFQAAVPPAAQQKQSSLTAALTTIGEAT